MSISYSKKKIHWLAWVMLFLFFHLNLRAQTADRSNDQAAIMKTIQQETDCFYTRDYSCWKENYVQDIHVFQGWSNNDGTYDVKVGWEKINASIAQYIKENPVPSGKKRRVERRNLQFKFLGDAACYMTWDQYQENREGNKFYHSLEIRVMEKQSGKWKIAGVAAFWDYINLLPIEDLKPE